jgi:hypothetical protein
MLHSLHFSIPGLLIALGYAPPYVNPENSNFIPEALFFVLVGIIAIHIGGTLANAVFLNRWKSPRKGRFQYTWKTTRILFILTVLLTIGWISRIYIISSNAYFQIFRTTQGELPSQFYAAIRIFEQFPLHAFYIISIRFWRHNKETHDKWRFFFLGMFVAELAYWLPSGRKEETILVILIPLLIRYLRCKILPSKKTILIIVLFSVILFPLTYYYRSAMIIGKANIYNPGETIIHATKNIATNNTPEITESLEIIYNRLALLEPISACIRIWETDIWDPMLGSSYYQAFLSFAPRFIWPEKPTLHYGNKFGHVAGYLSKSDMETSISVTFFGEAYLNFGIGGLFPLIGIGFIFGFFYYRMQNSARSETWIMIYSIILPTILYVGGTFALYFGGLIKLVPFYYVIGRFLEGGRFINYKKRCLYR